MKKIIFVLIVIAFTSCGKSLEQRAADAKYLQDIEYAKRENTLTGVYENQ